MRILEVLNAWLAEVEWDDVKPEVDEEKKSASANFSYMVNDEFQCDGYFETREEAGLFQIFVYPELTLPPKRLNDIYELVNAINIAMPIGTFHVLAEKRRLRFYTGIDVEDAEISVAMIHNMMGAVGRQLGDRMPRIAAVCFGGKSVQEALDMEISES